MLNSAEFCEDLQGFQRFPIFTKTMVHSVKCCKSKQNTAVNRSKNVVKPANLYYSLFSIFKQPLTTFGINFDVISYSISLGIDEKHNNDGKNIFVLCFK